MRTLIDLGKSQVCQSPICPGNIMKAEGILGRSNIYYHFSFCQDPRQVSKWQKCVCASISLSFLNPSSLFHTEKPSCHLCICKFLHSRLSLQSIHREPYYHGVLLISSFSTKVQMKINTSPALFNKLN